MQINMLFFYSIFYGKKTSMLLLSFKGEDAQELGFYVLNHHISRADNLDHCD